MSLEFALEAYPLKKTLPSGKEVVIRPLEKDDVERIKTFYTSVPEYERMFVKHPVNDMSILESWCCNIDYHSNLPLLVLDNDAVLADGTLHFRHGGWRKHIGLLSILTLPGERGQGLSELLVEELIELARHAGLHKLEVELNGEREIAIKSFAKAGFRELVRLPDYLQDMQTNLHDYVLMGVDLLTPEEYAGTG